jgi:enhancing lycopene biosynthesis protein 2
MTYGKLLEHLYELSPRQLNQNVTIYRTDTYPGDEDEYLPVDHIGVAVDDAVLDADHIVLTTGAMT